MSGFITPEKDVGQSIRLLSGRGQQVEAIKHKENAQPVFCCACVCAHEPMTNFQFSLLGNPPISNPSSPHPPLPAFNIAGRRTQRRVPALLPT